MGIIIVLTSLWWALNDNLHEVLTRCLAPTENYFNVVLLSYQSGGPQKTAHIKKDFLKGRPLKVWAEWSEPVRDIVIPRTRSVELLPCVAMEGAVRKSAVDRAPSRRTWLSNLSQRRQLSCFLGKNRTGEHTPWLFSFPFTVEPNQSDLRLEEEEESWIHHPTFGVACFCKTGNRFWWNFFFYTNISLFFNLKRSFKNIAVHTIKCTKLSVQINEFWHANSCNHHSDQDIKLSNFFPFTYFTHPPTPLLYGHHQYVFCVHESISDGILIIV